MRRERVFDGLSWRKQRWFVEGIDSAMHLRGVSTSRPSHDF
jgi:hypothetical protein